MNAGVVTVAAGVMALFLRESARSDPRSTPFSPFQLGSIKAAGVALLGLHALSLAMRRKTPKLANPAIVLWAGVGLLLGSFGDFLLEMDRWGFKNAFIMGLGCFLASHVSYIIGFVADSHSFARSGRFWASSMVLGLLTTAVIRELLPAVPPKLSVAVVAYATAILLMGITSISRSPPHGGTPSYLLLAVGAVLFMASDIVLAFNKWHTDIPHGRTINLVLYYAAQALIYLGAALRWSEGRGAPTAADKGGTAARPKKD